MNHKWKKDVYGVAPGSGRPHGVDEFFTCSRCGCVKQRGPQSTAKGKRVIRWSYSDSHGYDVDSLPECR